MKKYLLISCLLTRILCAGQSVTTDTLCFPVAVIQKVLIAAEQKKVLEERVTILDLRIAEKEQIISDLKSKDSLNKKIVSTYESEISVMMDQRKVFEDQIKSLDQALKKEKRKRFWTSVGAVASIGIMAYLYITK